MEKYSLHHCPDIRHIILTFFVLLKYIILNTTNLSLILLNNIKYILYVYFSYLFSTKNYNLKNTAIKYFIKLKMLLW